MTRPGFEPLTTDVPTIGVIAYYVHGAAAVYTGEVVGWRLVRSRDGLFSIAVVEHFTDDGQRVQHEVPAKRLHTDAAHAHAELVRP